MKSLNSILSILFMVLALILAFSFDRWISIERNIASSTFQFSSPRMAILFSTILLVFIWFLLAWWTLARRLPPWAALFYTLTGLVVLLYPLLRMTSGWAIFWQLRLPFIEPIDGHLAYTGLFVAVLGAVSWVLNGRIGNLDHGKPTKN
jgi:hypothetical protein